MLPYLVLLRVGFAMPRDVVPARGALLPHRFTITTHILRCRSAVSSLLHFPSAHAAQALPGTLPCGARTFLETLCAPRDCLADSAAILPRSTTEHVARSHGSTHSRSTRTGLRRICR